MDVLLNWFSDFKIDEEILFLGFILISTTLAVSTLSLFFIGGKSPIRQQLEAIRKDSTVIKQTKKSHRIGHTLDSLAPIISPRSSKERESMRHKLMHAGYHDANALTVFYAIKIFCLSVGILMAAAIYFFQPTMGNRNLVMVLCVGTSLFIPNMGLSYLVNKRQSRVRAGVPDALDLLVVCTESGLGFNAALKRVADELMISHPDFADELETVCAKIKAGVQMSDAFDNLIERTGITEITGLVNMLAHASRIGGSLSQTLREYTEDYRDRRNQEVEEIAAKIPTKMIFPLLLFIWPCFFIVAIGPSMLFLTATLGK